MPRLITDDLKNQVKSVIMADRCITLEKQIMSFQRMSCSLLGAIVLKQLDCNKIFSCWQLNKDHRSQRLDASSTFVCVITWMKMLFLLWSLQVMKPVCPISSQRTSITLCHYPFITQENSIQKDVWNHKSVLLVNFLPKYIMIYSN